MFCVAELSSENYCTLERCRHYNTHRTEAHFCRVCRLYGHSVEQHAQEFTYHTFLKNTSEFQSLIDKNLGKILKHYSEQHQYKPIYNIMYCDGKIIYIRRYNKNCRFEFYFPSEDVCDNIMVWFVENYDRIDDLILS
jgi:hypothetical protein